MVPALLQTYLIEQRMKIISSGSSYDFYVFLLDKHLIMLGKSSILHLPFPSVSPVFSSSPLVAHCALSECYLFVVTITGSTKHRLVRLDWWRSCQIPSLCGLHVLLNAVFLWGLSSTSWGQPCLLQPCLFYLASSGMFYGVAECLKLYILEVFQYLTEISCRELTQGNTLVWISKTWEYLFHYLLFAVLQ